MERKVREEKDLHLRYFPRLVMFATSATLQYLQGYHVFVDRWRGESEKKKKKEKIFNFSYLNSVVIYIRYQRYVYRAIKWNKEGRSVLTCVCCV